jgi:hypothetical protein
VRNDDTGEESLVTQDIDVVVVHWDDVGPFKTRDELKAAVDSCLAASPTGLGCCELPG